jgi:predicted membrane GTPase involved in stress response
MASIVNERALEFIQDDEFVEVTPNVVRVRKARLSTAKPMSEHLLAQES